MEVARLASQDLARPLELPEDGRGKRVERNTTAASREREAIVRVIHPRPGRVLVGWILAVSISALTALAKPSPPGPQELESRVEEYMGARVVPSPLKSLPGLIFLGQVTVVTVLFHSNTPHVFSAQNFPEMTVTIVTCRI